MSKFDAIPFYWLDTIKTVKQDKNNKNVTFRSFFLSNI